MWAVSFTIIHFDQRWRCKVISFVATLKSSPCANGSCYYAHHEFITVLDGISFNLMCYIRHWAFDALVGSLTFGIRVGVHVLNLSHKKGYGKKTAPEVFRQNWELLRMESMVCYGSYIVIKFNLIDFINSDAFGILRASNRVMRANSKSMRML